MADLKVLLADDQPVVRAGLTTILGAMDGFTVVGDAADGRQAVALAYKVQPDVCLFDINMPLMDGIEATAELNSESLNVPVVLITTFDSDENIHRALRAGVRGFLLKGSKPERIAGALRVAASGNALFEPEIMMRIVQRFATSSDAPQCIRPSSALTPKELEVLRLVAQGLSNADIAKQQHVSVSTVKFHVSALMSKLACSSRAQLVAWAYQSGTV